MQSNLYTVKDGLLVMHHKRPFGTVPFVKLGDEFKKVRHTAFLRHEQEWLILVRR